MLNKPDSVKGHVCLRDFMHKERDNRNMSVQEMKSLFQRHDVAHWVNGFLLLLTAGKMVLRSCGCCDLNRKLMKCAAVDNLFSEFAYEGMMSSMGKEIEEFQLNFRRLSYIGHDLLCSVCSMIHSACSDKKIAFENLGPLLFFGSAYKKR